MPEPSVANDIALPRANEARQCYHQQYLSDAKNPHGYRVHL